MIRTILFFITVTVFSSVPSQGQHHVHGDPHVDQKDGTKWDYLPCCVVEITTLTASDAKSKSGGDVRVKTEKWKAFPKAPASDMKIQVLDAQGTAVTSGWLVKVVNGVPQIDFTKLSKEGQYRIIVTSGRQTAKKDFGTMVR